MYINKKKMICKIVETMNQIIYITKQNVVIILIKSIVKCTLKITNKLFKKIKIIIIIIPMKQNRK